MAGVLALGGQRGTRLVAGLLQGFVGLCGVGGGLALIAEPGGALLGMTTEPLRALPFDDFLLPGVLLFLVVGVGTLVAAVATLRAWPRSGEIAVACGLALMGWVAAQTVLLGSSSGLGASFFALGLLELLQGLLLRRDAASRASDT